MTATVKLSFDELQSLAQAALRAAGAGEDQAVSLAKAVAAAERDGIASHGLSYVPTYCAHLACGKVNPDARPSVEVCGNTVRVDADCGFAHLPIEMGFAELTPLVQANGVAALSVTNSYNCGVLGYHTEALARRGLVALGFTNAPASIAPAGGRKAVFGTNPWSLAVPDRDGGTAFVIDQSASVVAKSTVMKHHREGREIPPGWALDAAGEPTTDPAAALAGGTMAPAGGYKGIGVALLVETFAACLAGATASALAAPFSGTAGGPPRTGQFFIAIEPGKASGGLFHDRLGDVLRAYAANDAARLPGARRAAARECHASRKIAVDAGIYREVTALAGAGLVKQRAHQ